MIGNALEQEIMDLYNTEIIAMYSINQIASMLNKKYPYINKKVTSLINQNIFKMTVVGRSHLCSLNLNNEETVFILILNDIRKKKAELKKNSQLEKISEYIEKIRKTAGINLVLKKNGGIIFVLEGAEKKEEIRRAVLKQALGGYKAEFLTKEEFRRLLIDEKSLHRERIILYGFEKYYEYVKEIEDDLKIRYSKLMP